jgi:predicted  nucleic acid-binding Zn-ribbon protein
MAQIVRSLVVDGEWFVHLPSFAPLDLGSDRIAEEARRAERALARYYAAFEAGHLDAARFEKRVSALETRVNALREQGTDLAQQLAPQAATSPDAAELAAVADNLETIIATAKPRQAKALLRLLIRDLRVNARSEIVPT